MQGRGRLGWIVEMISNLPPSVHKVLSVEVHFLLSLVDKRSTLPHRHVGQHISGRAPAAGISMSAIQPAGRREPPSTKNERAVVGE